MFSTELIEEQHGEESNGSGGDGSAQRACPYTITARRLQQLVSDCPGWKPSKLAWDDVTCQTITSHYGAAGTLLVLSIADRFQQGVRCCTPRCSFCIDPPHTHSPLPLKHPLTLFLSWSLTLKSHMLPNNSVPCLCTH